MNKINKDFLKEVFANAIGTLLAGAVLTILAFFVGKIDFFIKYWKELSFVLFLVFIIVTLIVWFKKIVRLEQKIDLKPNLITDIEEQLCRLDDKPKYKFLISKIRKHYQS